MDYDRIIFKTIRIPFTGCLVTDYLYTMEKELKALHAIRFECTAKHDGFAPEEVMQLRREETVAEYIEYMTYLYGKELQVVLNESDMQEYYLLSYWNSTYPRRYQITWETLEGRRWHEHAYNGLLTAQNAKHARERFRIWWDAKEYGRRPHPRHAFHVKVAPEK